MRSSVLLGAVTLAFFSAASPAIALIGLNQCGPGALPPDGMQCGHEELLLGYRDPAGACFWVCCPPNSDGMTYNCSGDPIPSDFKMDLRSVRPHEWKGMFIPGPGFERPAYGR